MEVEKGEKKRELHHYRDYVIRGTVGCAVASQLFMVYYSFELISYFGRLFHIM